MIFLPIISPLFFAVIMFFMWKKIKPQRILSVVSAIVSLVISLIIFSDVYENGIISAQAGGWPAPFGISFVADIFSAVMVIITAVVGLAVAVYSLANVKPDDEKTGYYPLYQILLVGINGAFLTGDIFNLYVWFEVMLISSFVLLALGGKRKQLEGAVKYVLLNLVSSSLFLAGIGMLYGMAGTLNMADLALKLPALKDSGLTEIVPVLFLAAFGIKSALFPLFFWLPSSYHTPSHATSAIFAGLLTKVGVYSLIRVFTLIFPGNDSINLILLIVAGLTMLSGVLGAASQMDFRKILSFHIISQIGYMIMGLALQSPLAIAGAIFYMIHHIIVKTNLFLVSGIVEEMNGTTKLKKLGGLYKSHLFTAALFLIPALSLAGIPPLSGFWAKFTIIKSGLDASEYIIVGVSLFVGLLTLFSMTKIWNEVFWKEKENNESDVAELTATKKITLYLPVIFLAIITITIGLNAGPFFDAAARASEELLNPAVYIEAVLGGSK